MTKILLVEDDKSLREIYNVRLGAEGYDIVSAGDGEEALALAIKERPDLIVSDVMMPKISGFDMLDILRSTTETKKCQSDYDDRSVKRRTTPARTSTWCRPLPRQIAGWH